MKIAPYVENDCKHPEFERIGVFKDRIYSETEEKCVVCGYIRDIGEERKDEKENERRRRK